ncbi:MAG: exonuclease SbcCD subunit D C-terminal domain-containing protein [Spirochaetaceae bacterium]|jgi:exonuclease SbcD|nr:exonuclease SbcCD subunit D C-terminal domain-containing protein [Spirochaetaceae bacterium]
MPVKVLHTSDWHLGAMLHNEERRDEHRRFLSWLLETIECECIDALVVSGDVFDVYAPSTAAQKLYYDFLSAVIKLKPAPDVFIVAGNHDSRHFLGAPAGILSELNIHIISSIDAKRPQDCVFEVKSRDSLSSLTICAVPFLRERDLNVINSANSVKSHGALSIFEQYSRTAAAFYHDVYKIAVAKNAPVLMTGHFFLDGGMKSDDYSERAREVGSLQSLPASALPDADYYALGHLHRGQAVGGRDNVRYSGSPLPMSFAESGGGKSVVIAVFDGDSAGLKPEICLKEIPLWQNLRQVKGCPDDILAELGRLRATGENVWVEVQVTEHDGDLFDFWNALEKEAAAFASGELPLESSCKILVKQDLRVRRNDGDWRDEDEGGGLSTLNPAGVFERFLQDEKVSTENVEVFMNMFNEIYNDVIVNKSGEAEI